MSTEPPTPCAATLAVARDVVAAVVQEAEYGRREVPDDLESMTCVCGTDIGRGDGFANFDTNAVEMDHGWDGKHFACQRCARVFDQSQHNEASGLVLVVAGPQEFTPLAEQPGVPTYCLTVGRTAEVAHLSMDALHVLAHDVAAELARRAT